MQWLILLFNIVFIVSIYGGNIILPDYANDDELDKLASDCSEKFSIDILTGNGYQNKGFYKQIALTCCVTICAFQGKGVLKADGTILENYPDKKLEPTDEFKQMVELLHSTCESFKEHHFNYYETDF